MTITRDIIAAAIAEHDGYEHVPARFDGAHAVWATSCQCDGWLIQGLGVDAWERHRADAVAAALRDAGLLPPDDAETHIEWGVRSIQHGAAAQHVFRFDSEAKADDMLDYRRHRAPAGCTDAHATKVRRTITTWDDGGMHITPWQTVEETP